ncbi:hypothetical protein GCM10022276_26580 [Sphingomonas limnosediminicola]|uniref:Uncharacterized protein n=1 Tax=Sphingomonas limnosediminicola TaxID=940133 RepID=A0ABP7LR05_9SPHN
MDDWILDDEYGAAAHYLEPHQVKAAAAPHVPIDKLASGNFKDLERLIEQLGKPPIFELGKPAPDDKFMPRSRIGGCPAAHNRALLGEDD